MTDKLTPSSSVVVDVKENGGTAGSTAEAPRTPSPAELAWEKDTLNPTLAKSAERQKEFTTLSDHTIRRLYTPADLSDWNAERDLGFPGQPPYTRGIHATMYRGKPLDHAPVRRLRHRGGHQPTLPLFAGPGPNRPFRRLRSPHLHGLRLRSRALRRRSRQMRRGHQFPRRHGSSLRSNSHQQTSPLP